MEVLGGEEFEREHLNTWQWDAATLRAVIRSTPDVPEPVKDLVIRMLEAQGVIQGDRASVLACGMRLGELHRESQSLIAKEFIQRIVRQINDLDRLPMIQVARQQPSQN